MGQPSVSIFELASDMDLSQESASNAWKRAKDQADASHVAFVAGTSISADELRACTATGADVAIIVEDSGRAAGGRASADLAAVIWQSFPSIAALLFECVSSAGAVVFSPATFHRVQQSVEGSDDPVTAAVLATVSTGGSVRAVLMPGDSSPSPPSAPPALVPQSPRAGAGSRIKLITSFDVAKSLGGIASQPDATAVKAGLLLWHDCLDESHRQSQSIEGEGVHSAGDYWHAIMHRREGDYGNAKYWFRRVGRSAVFEPLASRVVRNSRDERPAIERIASRIAPDGRWDPMAFVDACESVGTGPDDAEVLFLRRIQADEMLLLLWQTCLDAKGGS